MHMTTDANDTITLADIIAGHGRDLRERIDAAQKIPGSAGTREADRLLGKLTKLNEQAGRCGFKLDGSKPKQPAISPELAELRRTIARHEQNKSRENFIAEIAEKRAEIDAKKRGQ